MKRCLLISDRDFSLTWLKGHVGPGDTVVPLSLEGLMTCRKEFRNVQSVEEFVPYPEIMRLAVQSHELNREFSRKSCEGATLDGYDWPDICWHMQQWFFRDVLLAEALAQSLACRDFTKIVWMGDPGRDPSLYLPTYGAASIVLKHHLRGRFEILPPRGKLTGQCMRRFKKKVEFGLEQIYKHSLFHEQKITRCRVVAIWLSNEWDRYTDAMAELAREFREEFQLWVLGARYPRRLREWARTAGIVPVAIPFPDSVERDIVRFFQNKWEQWLTKGQQSFADAVHHSMFGDEQLYNHFKRYFLTVWPSMAQWARKLERYLEKARPSWLIGLSNYPPEWAFPHYVAEKMGISSIALPHSFVQYGDGTIGASHLACRNQLKEKIIADPFQTMDISCIATMLGMPSPILHSRSNW